MEQHNLIAQYTVSFRPVTDNDMTADLIGSINGGNGNTGTHAQMRNTIFPTQFYGPLLHTILQPVL